MTEPTCSRCRAWAGFWVTRPRLYPLDPGRMICLGTTDPGPDWWALVKRFWDVSDAPNQVSWVPPALIQLRDGQCQYCRGEKKRSETPSLFNEETEP
ncbi:MAG TPA: hypothetical protein VGE74_04735 [Gemmata sp.]